jgi:RimJ/RimL family protein N-acetyltransferase
MFARTQRLTLRPAWIEDAPALARAIGHYEVIANLSQPPWPYTLGDAEEFLRKARGPEDLFCLILLHEGPATRLIGGIGLHREESGYEFGYWLTPDAWGRGYATEAGRAVLANARHSLRLGRLRARHFVDNPASGNVLRKLGFTPSGRIVQQYCRARDADVPSVELEADLAGACPDDRPLMAA